MSSKWLVYLKAELSRRNLLRGGALLTVALTAPELAGCGARYPDGSSGSAGSTTGTGTTSSGSTSTSTSTSTSSTGSTTGTTGTSTSSTSTSGSGGTTGSACTQDANTFTVAASQIPVGGGVVITDNRYSDPQCGCGYNEFIVLQPSAGQFVALSTGCTHEFCSVRLTSGPKLFCNCHGSEFALDGSVIRGPATSALSTISTCTDGTTVFVQLA